MNESFTELKEIVAEYRVVDSTSLDGLTAAINERLKLQEGWEPFGPLIIGPVTGRFIQPIVRRVSVLDVTIEQVEPTHDIGGSD